MAKPIGTLGTIPTLEIGGRTFADLTTLIVLGCPIFTAGGAVYTTGRKNNTTSGYQVTTGKTLKIEAMTHVCSNATNVRFGLLYGDTDVGQSNASLPTTPVYQYGSGILNFFHALTSGQTYEHDTAFNVPAGKYFAVGIGAAQDTYIQAFGYET